MPRPTRGSTFAARDGSTGIRWPEDGKRPQKTGFANKTEARAGSTARSGRDSRAARPART
jgi:hypothetical protein